MCIQFLIFWAIWLAPADAGDPPVNPAPSTRHDFHVSIGRMAVEGNKALLQIRLFKDDLELGIQSFFGDTTLTLNTDPRTDSLFAEYLNDKFNLSQNGHPVKGVVDERGEDTLYGFPVFWYTLSFEAPAEFDELEVDHHLLMEVFEDQQNVLRISHFPSEVEKMYYLVQGSSDVKLSFEK
jgi:hypothetical protein